MCITCRHGRDGIHAPTRSRQDTTEGCRGRTKGVEGMTYDPPPFNPDFRYGFGTALEKEYIQWCEDHPDSTRDERRAAHKEIADRLMPQFPSVRELANKPV